jgi:hypothetical protein
MKNIYWAFRGSDDGSLLFVHHSTGLPRNYGDNYNVGRQLHAEVLDSERKQPAKQPARKKPPQNKPPPMAKKPPRLTKKPPPMAAKNLPQTTTCAIQGCTLGGTPMLADHKCYNKCGQVFHNLCAQMNDLCDEDNELDVCCSLECNRSKK